MFVRAVIAPQRAYDSQLGEGRLATQHIDESPELVRRQSVFGDERRRDERIAGPRLDLRSSKCHVPGFFGGVLSGVPDDGALLRASTAEIMRGELLVPLNLRARDRKTASTTLPLSSTTRSFMPHFFSQPLRYSR